VAWRCAPKQRGRFAMRETRHGNMDEMAKLLILFGISIALIGALLYVFGRVWGGGPLPGTLVLDTGNLTCIVPIGASILLSILLTVVLNLILRALNK
jgi:hypothetical protein